MTAGAAAGAVGWARRLTAHPVIAAELAAGELSESWAREFCSWTDRLPDDRQADADEILASAARAGVDFAGLAGLAREMYERSFADGREDADDAFADRYLRLGITFRGAGRAEGDLTPGCAAALDAVLTALSKKAGPEDTRTSGQRRHDALEEACRRLIASGMLPGRAGQPAQAHLHITLAALRDSAGASRVEAAWAAARASQPGWLTGPDATAAACDSTLVPIVTGHVDQAALDRLTEFYLATHGLRLEETGTPAHPSGPSLASGDAGDGDSSGRDNANGRDNAGDRDYADGRDNGDGRDEAGGRDNDDGTGRARRPLSPQTVRRLRETMLRLAADVMSGPGGLASWLRQSQLAGGPGGGPGLPLGIPLPLDTGEAEPTIPAHLRRIVTTRHTHCAFPGCRVPAEACHIHHLVPRARGGPTAIGNLVPLCSFHHLTAVHRWGWTLALHADGGATATSPDRARTLHDHGPPDYSRPGTGGAEDGTSSDGTSAAASPGARGRRLAPPARQAYYARRMATPRRYQSHDEDSARWRGFPYRDDDIVISTRSKTGTTWVQMICALLIFQQPRLPAPIAQLSPWLDHLIAPREQVLAQLAAQEHRRFIKTHTPLDGIPLDPRVTYLVTARHPLDVAVSLYHHSGNIDRARLRQLIGQPEPATPPPPLPPLHDWLLEWIADDHDPAERLDSLPGLMWHLSDAWARRDQPNILLVHYDNLSADLADQMRWLAGRLGITVPQRTWPALVRAATFESMSGNADTTVPTAGLFKSNAAFFRRGTSGAGHEILSDRELAAYHDRAARLAPADMLSWLHSPGAGEASDRGGA